MLRCITIILAASSLSAQIKSSERASDSGQLLSAPVMGLISYQRGTEVRAIVGVPGAANISEAFALPEGITRVHPAPAQRWALAETATGDLVQLDFSARDSAISGMIDAAISKPLEVAFSPTGRSAVLLSRAAGRIAILSALDVLPRVISTGAVSLPLSGELQVAVSDDGNSIAFLAADGHLYSRGEWLMQGVSGMAFLSDQSMLAVAQDNGTVSLIDMMAGGATRVAAAGMAAGGGRVVLQGTRDGRRLFLAKQGSMTATQIDLITGEWRLMDLPVAVQKMERLRNGEAFLLSADPDESAWLLVADDATPRALFAAPVTPVAQ